MLLGRRKKLADKKNKMQYDESGEDIIHRQINEAYHSGVIDGLYEEFSDEILEDVPAKENDPKA